MPRHSSRTRSSTAVPIEGDSDESGDEQDFERLIKQRRASRHGGAPAGRRTSRRNSSVFFDVDGHRRHSTRRSSGQTATEEGAAENADEKPAEENVFENIKIQKEIIHNLRKQPWRMRKKLKTLRMAKAYVEKYEGRLSKGQGYRQVWSKYQLRMKRGIDNIITKLTPWEMKIKQIESHFGSVVSSYFVFLRWVFFINLIVAVCFCGIIIVPEFLFGDPDSSRKVVPPESLNSSLDLASIWAFEGYLQYTFFFYGYYSNENLKINALNAHYFLPLAYLLVNLGSFGYCLITIMRKMAANSRLSKMSTDGEQFTFCWKVFSSWDFMIGNRETANNKVAALTTSFKEVIIEEEEKMKKAAQKRLTIFLRVLANFLVILVLAGSSYAVVTVVQRSVEFEQRVNLYPDQPLSWWEANEVSVSMSLITLLFPSIFDLIGMMEGFHPREALRWSLARILMLYLMNLYTLVIALQFKIDAQLELIADNARAYNEQYTYFLGNITTYCTPSPTSVQLTNLTTVSPASCTNVTAVPPPRKPNAYCWETMVGQEMYKLTVMDLVMTIGGILVIDFLRGLFVRYANQCWCWNLESGFPEYGEFKIAENILHLIYNQGMIWMGMFFAPALPALNILKLLAMLYVRAWAVIVCNVPHERVFKASRSNNFYFALLLMMLFVCAFPVGYCMVSFAPSPDCGPFSHRELMYDEIIMVVKEELPSTVYSVLNVIASSAVIVPVFILLIMSIYYLVSLTKSLKEANADLKEQLVYERTEEKKKIYAMADARNEAQKNKEKNGNKQRQEAKVTPAVAPKAKTKPKDGTTDEKDQQMVKIISGNKEKMISLAHLQQLVKNQPGSSKGEPQVALVHGKQSLIDRRSKKKRAPDLETVVNDSNNNEDRRTNDERSRRDDRHGRKDDRQGRSDDRQRHIDDRQGRKGDRQGRRENDDRHGGRDDRERRKDDRRKDDDHKKPQDRDDREDDRKQRIEDDHHRKSRREKDYHRGRKEKDKGRDGEKEKRRDRHKNDDSGDRQKREKSEGRLSGRKRRKSKSSDRERRRRREESQSELDDKPRNSKHGKDRDRVNGRKSRYSKHRNEESETARERNKSRDNSRGRSRKGTNGKLVTEGGRKSSSKSCGQSRSRDLSKDRKKDRKKKRRSSSSSSGRSKNSLDDNYVRNLRKYKRVKAKRQDSSATEDDDYERKSRKKGKKKESRKSEPESVSTESTNTSRSESESQSEKSETSRSKSENDSISSGSDQVRDGGRFKKNPQRRTSIVAAQINRSIPDDQPGPSHRIIPKILVEDKEVDSGDNWKRKSTNASKPIRKVSLPDLDLEHTDSSLTRMLKSKPNKNVRPPTKRQTTRNFLEVEDENQSDAFVETEKAEPVVPKASAWGRLRGKLVKPKSEVDKPTDVAEVKLETIGKAEGKALAENQSENPDTVIDIEDDKNAGKRKVGRGFAFLRSVVTLKKGLKKVR